MTSKCPVCDEKILRKKYLFCPMCGTRLDSTEPVIGYSLDRTRYLWERKEGGKILYKNFKTIKNFSDVAFRTTKPVRTELGDFAHINLLNLRRFSFSYVNPDQIYELYNIGKLIGYFTVNAGLEGANIVKLVDKLSKTGLFWKLFENKVIQEKNAEGWRNSGAGFLKLKEIDRKKKKQVYQLTGSTSAAFHAPLPTCFMEVGCLCGQAEGLFGGIWEGRENECEAKGDTYNEYEIYSCEREEKPKIDLLTKEELNKILDEIVGNTSDRSPARSEEHGDLLYIVIGQILNYYLVSLSPGHRIVSKYTGRICGERIAKQAKLEGLKNALDYLADLFLYLKAGIINWEEGSDRIVIKMQESVYASGVSNIDMELCIFLAGIMEGILNVSTGEKWDVNERKCIATGFPECEFHCKTLR